MIENYEDKNNFLYNKQDGKCPVCNKELYIEKTDLHHAGTHNKKSARQKYPMFVNSVINLVRIHHNCHLGAGANYGKMQEIDIANIEVFLECFKECITDGIIEQKYNVETHQNVMNFEGTERGVIANREYIRLFSKLHCDMESLQFTQKEIWEAMGK